MKNALFAHAGRKQRIISRTLGHLGMELAHGGKEKPRLSITHLCRSFSSVPALSQPCLTLSQESLNVHFVVLGVNESCIPDGSACWFTSLKKIRNKHRDRCGSLAYGRSMSQCASMPHARQGACVLPEAATWKGEASCTNSTSITFPYSKQGMCWRGNPQTGQAKPQSWAQSVCPVHISRSPYLNHKNSASKAGSNIDMDSKINPHMDMQYGKMVPNATAWKYCHCGRVGCNLSQVNS